MKLRYAAAACAALILAPIAAVHLILRASLPTLDGAVHRMGVLAPVTIERDALGVPTITASSRADLAFATGFVHGQDRFFQMDLSRRLAAGELSELFGEAAIEQDRKARLFRFRHVAQEALKLESGAQRTILEAYARGVNAGLASLGSRPWEYWLLRSEPVAWRPEDSVLVSHAMWWDLQYPGLTREIHRLEINARMEGAECSHGWKCDLNFLFPARTEWDAPNAEKGVAVPPATAALHIPEFHRGGAIQSAVSDVGTVSEFARETGIGDTRNTGIGSNNWAVAGRLTSTGAALVANDMHLNARVPTVWYRARMRVTSASGQVPIDLNGVTLPGAPVLVAGSNGRIAWGFTNSYGDWYNVARVACTAVGDDEISTATGPLALTVAEEEIRVRGSPSVTLAVKSGPSGVLFEAHPENRTCWFATWLAQQPAATNMNLMALERAGSVAEALEVAPTLGIPHQNFVIGDREGHIAWTIAGRVPLDTSDTRSNGRSAWTGADGQPRIVDPEVGRIWTANARATDDPAQETAIGGIDASVGADYDLGARARQIRDDLLAMKDPATPADMLRIQLDDHAVFLSRWRSLLIDLLDADSLSGHPGRAQFRRLVSGWNARASVDSVGYRLVRAYHDRTQDAVWQLILEALQLKLDDDSFEPSQFEAPLWRIVTERPATLLNQSATNWRQFLLTQVDATVAALSRDCPALAHCTWGSHRPVEIRHPLSRALPFSSRLLDMPRVLLPGDHDMPRVQDGPMGASERFAVSPGHEVEGYIHIPGGQSGHPLSPYYRAGFMSWANGTPAPFLPGPAQHQLTLQPE